MPFTDREVVVLKKLAETDFGRTITQDHVGRGESGEIRSDMDLLPARLLFFMLRP